MTAVFCHNAADRSAETWGKQLAPFERLEFALSDAAKGIASAVALAASARRDDPSAAALGHGLDVFHTAMEAKRVLAGHWRRAESAWEQAETADVKLVFNSCAPVFDASPLAMGRNPSASHSHSATSVRN
jgi:hypothetical protein